MPHTVSPYDRPSGALETRLWLAVIFSVGLHLVAAWVFLVVFPALDKVRVKKEDVIIVELLGAQMPAAPAAPKAKVNPNLKGPDVVEAPKSDPAPAPQPQFTPPTPEKTTAPPEVIPLGPKAPEKPPEIKKKETPPPKPTPPKVETEQPKPKPQAKPNPDADLNKRMAELERKVAARDEDEEIEARMINLAKEHGGGDGAGSEDSGSNRGQQIDPRKAAYYRQVREIISRNWVPPAGQIAGNPEARYVIRIEPSGRISALRLLQSSGDQTFDLSMERAVKQSSLPPLPDVFGGQADNPGLVFNMREVQRIQRQQQQ